MRIPELGFARHRRCERERGDGVSGWERSVLITLQSAPQLEVVWILGVYERPLAPCCEFYPAAEDVGEENRLDAVQSERLHPALPVDAPDQVNAGAGNERAGIGQQPESRCRRPEEPVFLRAGILEPPRDFHVDR